MLEEAAAREVEEETGLKVRVDRLLGVFSDAGNRTVFVAYAGHVIGGQIECGEECIEVRGFAPDGMPEFAFPHDGQIMELWAIGREG